jgi:hypothetical protein
MDTQNDTQFNLRISRALLAMLDAVRAREPDVPTRPEMIRRLIARAGENQAQDRQAEMATA